MNLVSRFLLVTAIVLLSVSVSGYEIVGECVIEDNPNFQIMVCPHTSVSPVGAFEQTFTLWNKSGQNFENNVYAVYRFDSDLLSGSAERWVPPSYGWVQETLDCPIGANYAIELNRFPGTPNPHYGECFDTSDLNAGGDVNTFYFKERFESYDLQEREIYIDENKVVSGNRWSNVTNGFSKLNYLNDTYYYTNIPTTLMSGNSKTWKINYAPSAGSKKWELGLYVGDSPTCIFNDDCDHVVWLDPWFDTDFTFRRQITVTAGTEIDNTMTLDINSLDTTDTAKYQADCDDLRIVFQDAADLNRIVLGCGTTDTKVYWKAQATISSGSSSTDYKIYHGNSSATAPSVDMNNVGLWGDRFQGSVDGSWTVGGSNQNADINSDQAYESTSSLTQRTTGDSFLQYNFGAIHTGDIDIITWILDDPNDTDGIVFSPWIQNGTPISDLRIGIQTDINSTDYVVFDGVWIQLSNSRTAAWHEFRVEYFDTNANSSVFIDDVNVFGGGGYKLNTTLRLYTSVASPSDLNVFFDPFLIRTHVDNKPAIVLAADEIVSSVSADFDASPAAPYVLDPDGGITSITIDFNDTSTYLFGDTFASATWDENSTEFSTDQNSSRTFTTIGDFNITQIVTSTDGNVSQQEKTISILQAGQTIDINFVFNAEPTLADVNFGVTVDGNAEKINFAVWGFPNDNNLSGLVVNQQYRLGDNRQVCVVVNTTGDVNKLHCENFFTTRVITKIPKDITNLSLITPFDASIDSVPPQSFSGLSVDGNFWFFYQGLDSNTHNLIVDANVTFFLSTYFIGLNGVDLNQTIQPYMVPATDGINVIITAKDSLTNNTVQGVVAAFNRIVSTDGDVLAISGVTDDLGRISLPFIAGIDHNFTIQFPFGTILRTGTYIPQTIDATDGIGISVASTSVFDTNAIGVTDVNFLQSQVTPASPIDLNAIVTSSRTMSAVTYTVDHNGVQLFTDTNSNCPTTCQFNRSQDVAGLDEKFPLIEIIDVNYTDGGSFRITKAVTISRTPFGLFESFTTVKTSDLGDIGGTMFLSAIIIAILLGIVHFTFPSIDNSPTFVLAATILLFLSFVGWVDGVTWVIATIGAGAVYFMRKVDK